MCGGKVFFDKCVVCGGNNVVIGCDGKCFSGMREDIVGNCCYAAIIIASGMCGEGDNLFVYFKVVVVVVCVKVMFVKKNVFLVWWFINFVKVMLCFVLKVVFVVFRVVVFVIRFVSATVIFTLYILFFLVSLKLVGMFIVCYMVIGVVDKKV